MLRMESANQEIDGRPLPPAGDDSRARFRPAFGKCKSVSYMSLTKETERGLRILDMIKAWVENNLDIYKVRSNVYFCLHLSNWSL